MAESKIEWTEMTWNPTSGCTKISSGCKNCYAERMAKRLEAMGMEKYRNGFQLTLHPNLLDEPYSWRSQKVIFVNSMSDLFHEAIPFEFIKSVFKVMNANPQHIFQVLTKRAEQLAKYSYLLNWTRNIWMGVSIEDFTQINRLKYLKSCGASTKFLSLEPLLTEIPRLDLSDIDWVIVGGESGPKSRPIQKEWVLSIRDNCSEFKVPFFFKQWGGKNKKKSGRLLDGMVFNEMPQFKSEHELLIS
jgi:protein gp37